MFLLLLSSLLMNEMLLREVRLDTEEDILQYGAKSMAHATGRWCWFYFYLLAFS